MKPNFDPRLLLMAAFILLMTGFLLPLLMIMQIIESTLFLNFFAYVTMTLGSMLGFIGAASLAIKARRR